MKIKCSKCGEKFEKGCKGSYWNRCVECRNLYYRKHYNTIDRKNRYKKNKESVRKQSHQYYLNHIEDYKIKHKIKNKILKIEVLSHYSNNKPYCKKCNKTDLDILSIDHIDGGGLQHFKQLNIKGGINFYRWLKKNNYPIGYQVLCMGCQFIKRHENNECGHINSIQRHQYKLRKKLNIISYYSNKTNKCKICGETDIKQLIIDHINNDGNTHRKLTKGSGTSMYDWIIKNKYPDNPPLQVLCINCNVKKSKL